MHSAWSGVSAPLLIMCARVDQRGRYQIALRATFADDPLTMWIVPVALLPCGSMPRVAAAHGA